MGALGVEPPLQGGNLFWYSFVCATATWKYTRATLAGGTETVWEAGVPAPRASTKAKGRAARPTTRARARNFDGTNPDTMSSLKLWRGQQRILRFRVQRPLGCRLPDFARESGLSLHQGSIRLKKRLGSEGGQKSGWARRVISGQISTIGKQESEITPRPSGVKTPRLPDCSARQGKASHWKRRDPVEGCKSLMFAEVFHAGIAHDGDNGGVGSNSFG